MTYLIRRHVTLISQFLLSNSAIYDI